MPKTAVKHKKKRPGGRHLPAGKQGGALQIIKRSVFFGFAVALVLFLLFCHVGNHT